MSEYHPEIHDGSTQCQNLHLSYLSTKLHLPVVPMIDPSGIITIPDETHLVLFPFIASVKYLNTPSASVRQLRQTLEIARFLGRMHSNVVAKDYPLVPSNRSPIRFAEVKYELVKSCGTFQKECPDLYERIRRIIDKHTSKIPLLSDPEEQQQWKKVYQAELPVGDVHADLHDDNVLWVANEEKLAAVLDCDDMYIGPLLVDLAMALCFWCVISSEFNFAYAKEFVRVYQIERRMSLTENEWNLLEIFCYLTILNQVLFSIESETDEMIDELLCPIESISKSEGIFVAKIR